MSYQIAVADTSVLVEPDTYYPTKESAERAKARVEASVPAFAGKLIVVFAKLPKAELGLQGDL